MATLYIDGRPFEADPERNVLEVCLGHRLDLPYFCWHPALGSVGACRQCAVKQFKDENDTDGMIVMSCMVPAADGTRISIDDDEARRFRASVIEWLMTSHPHDCPVCEEGGECHLQDMTVMAGHAYRRYRFAKRTFRNQDLGPFLGHEMNRCITCYRCVRFYREYAGGTDLEAFGVHNHVYFGRHEDGPLENEFSGNLAEVCPTGVFTDRTLGERYTRKWDLASTPSICVHCGLGCNTTANERYGELRRILNRYNGAVNRYFLCDRGRFGYGFVNGDERLRMPRVAPDRHGSATEALAQASKIVKEGRTIGIGSPRASLEANFALRTLVGAENFHLGLAETERRLVDFVLDTLAGAPVRIPSLAEIEEADAVLVLGEDVAATAPRLALSLRQSVRQAAFGTAAARGIPRWQDHSVRGAAQSTRSPLVIAAPGETRLDDIATETLRAAPDDIARFGFAVARELDPAAPAVPALTNEERELARRTADHLRRAERPVIVSGMHLASEPVVQAAADVASALAASRDGARPGLVYTVPECNTLGLAIMGGGTLGEALTAMQEDKTAGAIVLENDLHRRAPGAEVDAALAGVRLVALDSLQNGTVEQAEVVLPSATFAEGSGTLVSNEGRAQRYFQALVPEDDAVRDGWRWLAELGRALGHDTLSGWEVLDDVTGACAAAIPALADIPRAAPQADYRIAGMRLNRAPHRYSGRTATHAHRTIWEPRPPQDEDSPLSHSMEGYYGDSAAGEVTYFWAPGWNSVQAVNKFQQEIGGPLRGGDPGVRLIEPAAAGPYAYHEPPPEPFEAREDEWLVVPFRHIFASEELSARAPAVAARAPDEPQLALNRQDAAALGVEEGGTVDLVVAGEHRSAHLTLRSGLPRGVAGFLVGLPGERYLDLPARGRVRPGGRHG